MGQDLRELFKKEREERQFELKKGHESRFSEKLDNVLQKKKRPGFNLLKIAASFLILMSIGLLVYQQYGTTEKVPAIVVDKNQTDSENKDFSFGDLSPDLKKVENYYVANINIELSQLEVSKENKDLVDSFMDRLVELNLEYKNLNLELNELGPNDQTITALIENLQLRLQLLQKLKKKLNQLKSSKNEQIIKNSI